MAATKRSWTDDKGQKSEAWASSFYDDNGKRHRKSGFKTKREADQWERDERERLKRSSPTSKAISKLTVRELCNEWLAHQKDGLGGKAPIARSTYHKYEICFRRHIFPMIGGTLLVEFNRQAAIDFRANLIKKVGRDGAKTILKNLSAPMNYAVEREYLAYSPTHKVTIQADSREPVKIRMPTREEMKRILDELTLLAETETEIWSGFMTMFFLLQQTGMRISEARGLAWSEVNLDQGFLTVIQKADNYGVIGRPKSRAAIREIPLSDVIVNLLKRWKPLCPQGELNLVFPNGSGRVESKNNLYHRRWVPLCKRLNLGTPHESKGRNVGWSPPFGFHAARHFRVSELIAAQVDVRQIMGEIGHKQVNLIFETYGHLFPDDRAARRERSNRLAENLVKK